MLQRSSVWNPACLSYTFKVLSFTILYDKDPTMWFVMVLMLSLSLTLGQEVESGCADWTTGPKTKDVCCQKCKPGNRLVAKCGQDPKNLCVPCENETYITEDFNKICKRCKQCNFPFRVQTPCTASQDTVCECAHGSLCGDLDCSFCVQECGKGKEPTNQRGCRPCPAGTFNDKIHHPCIKWNSICPSPNQKIVKNGTSTSDIVCKDVNTTVSPPRGITTVSPRDDQTNTSRMNLIIALICVFLLISFSLPLCVAINFSRKMAEKPKPSSVESPIMGRRQTPEPEQCSFCLPQEEHGRSSQSSLLSDDKPFELVV